MVEEEGDAHVAYVAVFESAASLSVFFECHTAIEIVNNVLD